MEDEHGIDEKILAVPVDQLNPYYDGIEELTDVPEILREQIEHFFATIRSSRRESGSRSPGGSIAARRKS
jgi:inorganic pyrophosphatase